MTHFAVTIFLSAFLLFQVQPLIGRAILPWFGGGPAVWTACMLFFQVLLLGGYTYAHVVRTRLSQRAQVWVHVALLVAALFFLPIVPSSGWKPHGGDDPTLRILLLLAATVGLPYFLLSTTGPLLQAWFSVRYPGRSPYRLYALSNVGSLLALVSYPFVVEPALALQAQSTTWSVGFGVFVALCAACALGMRRVSEARGETDAAADDAPAPGWGVRALWVALAACGSTMLLAVPNQMSWDVAVVPFLWVVPLALYLLSFVICFEYERWYIRPVFWPLLAVGAASMVWLMFEGVSMPIRLQVGGYSGGLFFCCMVCHGELVRLKPSPRHLTSFYLMVSAGGALGGLFVSVLAPAVFATYLELHIGILATCALALVVFLHERGLLRVWLWPVQEVTRGVAWGAGAAALVGCIATVFPDVGKGEFWCEVEPVLWLLPMLLYTGTFVLRLEARAWYAHPAVQAAAATVTAVGAWCAYAGMVPKLGLQVGGYAAGLCLWYAVVHGELARLVPDRAGLRLFYLIASLGGAVSAAFMALAAPAGLTMYLAVHVGLWAAATVALAIYLREHGRFHGGGVAGRGVAFGVAVAGSLVALAGFLVHEARDSYSDVLSLSRNFYGVLSVRSHYHSAEDDTEWLYRTLAHGRITHGSQYVAEEKRLEPIGYYAGESGVGLAVLHLREGAPQRVGVIGLGTGTLAAYGREGDAVRFYEINPEVERLARTWFTYLAATPATVEVVLGDARISLEREEPQQFDVLAIDAFSSDAIPVHLLTREAFGTYLRHMKPDGVIAVHISNRYLDLRPVVLGAAEHFGLKIAVVDSDAHAARKIYSCTWVLLTRNGEFLEREEVAAEIDEEELHDVEPLLWTDDYSNLFQILN